MIVYVDVDDTLVRWAGSKSIPRTSVIEKVKTLAREGNTLYLWSTGGADYARKIAGELGIEELFTSFLPKPELILDDQAVEDWRDCRHEYPW